MCEERCEIFTFCNCRPVFDKKQNEDNFRYSFKKYRMLAHVEKIKQMCRFFTTGKPYNF